MLKKASIILAAAAALFVLAAMTQPADYRVERSILINTPPSVIFPLINDFHQSFRWSPWADRDPAMQTTFSGPSAGVGAVYSWDGNDEVGSGTMTMIESRPDQLVRMSLHNTRPFESTSTTAIELIPEGAATEVEWSLSGEFNFIERAMSLFFSMDDIIGPDFEEGLARLKALAEAAPATP